MNRAKQILKIASIYMGAVLGAGFAGGRELFSFFVKFGQKGVLASIGAGLLFSFFGALILYQAKTWKCNTYKEYLNILFGKKIALVFSAVSNVFLFVCFVIMFSGSGALFNDCFDVPNFVGCFLTAMITFIVLCLDLKGIGTVCSFLVPFMLAGILYTDICSIISESISVAALSLKIKDSFFVSAILYVSYNMLSCTPALVTSASLAENKRTAFWGGLFGGVFLLILCSVTCGVLCIVKDAVFLSELPMLSLAGRLNRWLYFIYAVILYMAILTTSFSAGMPLVKSAEGNGVPRWITSFMLCTVSIPLSFFKFSVLVDSCYKFFGYLGMALLIKIITTLKTREIRR